MQWRVYRLVGFLLLLSPLCVWAEERGPSPLAPTVRIEPAVTLAALGLPVHDLLGVEEAVGRKTSSGENAHTDHPVSVTATALTSPAAPPALVLSAPVHALVGAWLPSLTRAVSSVDSAATVACPPWRPEKNASLARVDQVWRVAPPPTLTQRYDGLTIDGGQDVALEVHAGSTKKDRATNALKGVANTQMSLLPEGDLLQRVGRSFGLLRTDDARGVLGPGQLHLVMATQGAYTFNPSTRALAATGEMVGTLSWTTLLQDRFRQDPWRLVAFRWQPTVHCESRRPLGEEQNAAKAGRGPLATLTGNLHGDLRFDFLSPQLVASGTYQYGRSLTDAQAPWEQTTVSWKYQMNAQVALGGSFTQGGHGPSQSPGRGFTLEMGVKF